MASQARGGALITFPRRPIGQAERACHLDLIQAVHRDAKDQIGI